QYSGDQQGDKEDGDDPFQGNLQQPIFAHDQHQGDKDEQDQGHAPSVKGPNLEQVDGQSGRDHIEGRQDGEGGYQGDQGIDPQIGPAQIQVALHQTFFGHRCIADPKLKKGILQ